MFTVRKNANFIILIIMATLIFWISNAFSQVELSGYYENTFQVIDSERSRESLLNSSKLRIDFQAGGFTDEELEFRANISGIVNHGASSFKLDPYLPEYVIDSLHTIEDIFLQATGDTISLTEMQLEKRQLFLDNAYFIYRTGSFKIKAGRQQLSWGPGYTYNPTDLFHKKDPLNPNYEKPGVNALRIDYHWGFGGRLSAIFAPGDQFDRSDYAARFEYHISQIGYDIGITGHSIYDSTGIAPDLETAQSEGSLFLSQKREAVGLDFSGSLLGLGLWFEGNYNFMEKEDDFFRGIAGIDYTLDNGLYLMSEFVYNGRAEKDSPYPLHDWMASLYYGEPVGQMYGVAGLRHDLTDLLSASLYCFAAPDGTVMINPHLDYSLGQNADLKVYGGMSAGDDEGMYPQGQLFFLARGTVYF